LKWNIATYGLPLYGNCSVASSAGGAGSAVQVSGQDVLKVRNELVDVALGVRRPMNVFWPHDLNAAANVLCDGASRQLDGMADGCD
jgi:hypothetical protein